MTIPNIIRAISTLCSLATLSMLQHTPAAAATAPYYDDFDQYSVGSTPTNFTSSTTGIFPAQQSTWQIANPSGSNGMYSNSVIGHGANSSAAISITNLDQTSFQLSTTFQLGGYYAPDPTSSGRAGLAALSWGPDLSAGYQLSYQVYGSGTGNNQPNGTLTLYRPGTYYSTILASTYGYAPLAVTFGTVYTMTLSGFYSAAGLTLTGSLSDANGTLSISAVDSAPLVGGYFGYYDAIAGSAYNSSQMAVSYDNFSITVPEPRITALLLTASAAILLFRRLRKSASN